MRTIFHFLLLCLTSMLPGWAQAAATPDKESTYNVEVLVFATRLPQLEGNELWTQDTADTGGADLKDAERPGPAAPVNILSAAARDLAKDGRFRVLGYYSWVQAADVKSASKPIRVRGANPARPDELDGTMRLYLSRYLHLDVNLNYREDAGTAGNSVGKMTYRINEQRRIKSQETHYFDHPKFGALVRLTPVAPEK